MKKHHLIKLCNVLLIINTFFWLIIASYFSLSKFGENAHWIIKALLFLESILYLISYVGITKKIRIIYLFTIVLAFGNTILSITDQVDLSDIISLILSGMTFLSLISIWKIIFQRK